ncbi:MAG: hypothetical protein EXR29_11890 [Betaproteobacteria bacterium]|nr:hypothetical protein [Betaproteobacteria bacterium]
MNRRDTVLAVLALGSVPLVSFAQQQGKVWRVGFLSQNRANDFSPFSQKMRELGYVEGKDLVIEWRSAEGDLGRLPTLAAELVNLKVDAIVASATPSIGRHRRRPPGFRLSSWAVATRSPTDSSRTWRGRKPTSQGCRI